MGARNSAPFYARMHLPAGLAAEVDRIGDLTRRMLRRADRLPELGGLGLAWATVVGIGVATAGVLQALGPPPQASMRQVAAANQPAPLRVPTPPRATARHPEAPAIPTLLARVQGAISENPDGPPPGDDAAHALQQVAALPTASDGERALVTEMASDLYDRAKIALDAGHIDEEQRWLALGSILAPPPDLAPTTQLAEQAAAQPGTENVAEPPRDFTPNEAEADTDATPPAQTPALPVKHELAASNPRTQAPAQLGNEAAPTSSQGDLGPQPSQPGESRAGRSSGVAVGAAAGSMLAPTAATTPLAAPSASAHSEPAPTEFPAQPPPGARPLEMPETVSGTTELAAAGPAMHPGAAEALRSEPETDQQNAEVESAAEAPKRSPVAIVTGFYAALHRGDGLAAQDFLAPEKRGHGHYAPAAMSRFYGGLAEPLVLLSARAEGDHSVAAQYHFRSGSGACNGTAVVELRDDMIQSITAKNHC